MRQLSTDTITAEVARLCIEANYNLGEDVIEALRKAVKQEESPLGKEILQQLLENAEIARREQMPLCQDTGFADVFLEVGQEVKIAGGNLTEAITEGIRKGYKEGYLRKSIVSDPLCRVNTGDNTPAVIHTEIVPGDRLKVSVLPKGAGSENMSGLAMLRPADGEEGVKKFVLDSLEKAGGNPCPPLIVGVGLGGTAEKTLYLAKKSLLRP
ncbi:MAG: fumarate hydratase, partial [Candidatus Latescibacteria bacterium]|nr:fumarate hydratase [Candidatus Latescibacterota bacterium]